MPTVRRRVVVDGVVQGVFYRASARRVADAHGVSGWARNRADGRVELELEGEEDDVDAVVDWSRRGPSRAVVTSVQVDTVEPTGERGFRTR
jgi:acylphosphatase